MSDRYGSIAIGEEKSDLSSKKPGNPLRKHSTPTQKKKNKRNQHNSTLWGVLGAFFCIASYFLAGIYLAPIAIQKYLPLYIEDKTGLHLTMGRSTLNPVNFQLTLQDIVADLPQSPVTPPLLQIKSLFIDLDLTAIIRNTFTCDTLTIEELALNLIRHKDKSYNIPVSSPLTTVPGQDEIISFAELPFLFSLNNIAITKSRILFSDELTRKSHSIEELELAIPSVSNFSFQSDNYIRPHFSAVINSSPIQLSGKAVQLGAEPGFQTQLSCSIQSLDLVPYFSYLPDSFPLILSQGRADTSLQIAFAPNKKHGEQLSIDIRMTAADVEIQEKNNAFQLTVPTMKVDALLKPFSKQLHIRNIITRKTHLRGDPEQLRNAVRRMFSSLGARSDKGAKPFALSIETLLADQGQLTLNGQDPKAAKKSTSQWNSLQISINDFKQGHTLGAIRLSGEHSKGKASFSWQGKSTQPGIVKGKLLLNAFPAEILFNQLLPGVRSDSNNTIQGSTTFSGDLHFRSGKNSQLLYSISNGLVQFHKLKLTQNSTPWLTADSVRITRLSRTDKRYNLGNIFLKETTLSLDPHALPPLFMQLFTATKRPQMKGINFVGDIQLKGDTAQQEMVQISDVHFQLNTLEKIYSTENFTFTGNFGTKGVIKAKGICNLPPLRLQAELVFSDVDVSLAAPLFSKWPLLKNSNATLNGKGSYRFPDPFFQGDLHLSNTVLQKTAGTSLLGWDLGEFTNIRCHFAPFSLRADSLLLDKAQLHWQRDTYASPLQALHTGLHELLRKTPEKDILYPIHINTTSITNASLTMVDTRITPAWESSVIPLQGNISNFNTTEKSPSSFTLNGTMAGAALNLSGALTLLQNTADGNASLTLTDFPLIVLAPQLKQIPVRTDSAHLDLTMHMIEKQAQYSCQNELLIKDLLPLSTASDTALALAFLQDPSGSFPLSVQIDDPERSLIQKSVTDFQTTVIKASYAPLLLDRSFKDLYDKTLIPFQPGTSILDSTGEQLLGRYAELLVQHPGLSLSLLGMADEKTDRASLLEPLQILEQQRLKKANSIALAEYRQQQAALALARKPDATDNTLQEEDITQKDLAGYTPLLPQAVHVSDKALLDLAGERKLIVSDYCLQNLAIPPEKLAVIHENTISKDSPGNGVGIVIKTSIAHNKK